MAVRDALHCHLKASVPLVVIGFDHVAGAADPYSTQAHQISTQSQGQICSSLLLGVEWSELRRICEGYIPIISGEFQICDMLLYFETKSRRRRPRSKIELRF